MCVCVGGCFSQRCLISVWLVLLVPAAASCCWHFVRFCLIIGDDVLSLFGARQAPFRSPYLVKLCFVHGVIWGALPPG